jgi:hypothetical protein
MGIIPEMRKKVCLGFALFSAELRQSGSEHDDILRSTQRFYGSERQRGPHVAHRGQGSNKYRQKHGDQ